MRRNGSTFAPFFTNNELIAIKSNLTATTTMYPHYYGLTNQEVIENRGKYGANCYSGPAPDSWKTQCEHLFTCWLLRVFICIDFAIAMIMAIYSAVHTDFHESSWKLLLISILMTIFLGLIAWLSGSWNVRRKRWVVDIFTSIMLVVLYIVSCIAFYRNVYQDISGIGPYRESIGLAIVMTLVVMVRYWHRRNKALQLQRVYQVNNELPARVVRVGELQQIPRKDIVVGDIIILQKGDEVPADAYLLEVTGELWVDECQLTGVGQCYKTANFFQIDEKATILSTKVLKGSVVIQGEAVARVCRVGNKSGCSDLE